jgi:hypothetical protein
MEEPPDTIKTIEASLRVFTCGLLALVPLLGLVPAGFALASGWKLQRRHQDINPAGYYVRWGCTLALIGIAVSFVFALLIGLHIANNAGRDDSYM